TDADNVRYGSYSRGRPYPIRCLCQSCHLTRERLCCLEARCEPIGQLLQIGAQRLQMRCRQRQRLFQLLGSTRVAQAIARTTDGEALLVEQLANAAHQQHFMVLVIPSVAATLQWPQLREFLLPVTEHVRFDTTEFGNLTDGEIT